MQLDKRTSSADELHRKMEEIQEDRDNVKSHITGLQFGEVVRRLLCMETVEFIEITTGASMKDIDIDRRYDLIEKYKGFTSNPLLFITRLDSERSQRLLDHLLSNNQ